MSIPEKCPLCGSSRHEQSVVTVHVYGSPKDRGNAFFYCKVCDVRYQYPGLTAEEEKHFYAAEFEKFMANRSGEKG
ncbi:hypothetical protein [Limnospira platensis]|uniref:hypothetical protein n=1 Tax=Limnospira platensis TaxID=118562 RepID=UPI000A9984CD|nr:hypothetical protein APLC1_2257 [Arthrospira platensis C1]